MKQETAGTMTKPATENYKVPFTVTAPLTLIEQMDAEANRLGISRSDLIRTVFFQRYGMLTPPVAAQAMAVAA